MDINKLRDAIQKNNFKWRKHTLIRLAERNISQYVVLEVILESEVRSEKGMPLTVSMREVEVLV